jgi:hypothetical protein
MLKNFHEYFEENKNDDPPVNFAAVEPLYKAPPFPAHPDADKLQPDQKIYNGNCHCGAVTYAVKTKSLEEQKVMSCNCSLCSRVSLSLSLSLFVSPSIYQTSKLTSTRTAISGYTPQDQQSFSKGERT